ncbi:hypothetical protein CDQ96_04505 (plasmid) [Borrelia miyamotoi]|uniref:hypothetical protein n=1 Tax=Borrelia miyamotoi TaxID=47466 RepID=UPI000B8D59A5|nr:hypothetical protein [Borrelia miyamotoi]ASQ29672.1 hypothetical protein CDQ96_04505 [Borrelia miyamotoi]
MGKIKSFLFKVYVCFLSCFFMFFVFFFVLFISPGFMNNFFNEGRYNSFPYNYNDMTDMIGKLTYFKEFDHSSIKSISFVMRYLNVYSKDFEALNDKEKQRMIDSYPTFELKFMVPDKRLLNFKNVIFDGVDAKLYHDQITESKFNSSDAVYFQIDGNSELPQKILGQHLVNVENIFNIKLNEVLFRALREQQKLKITLISHDNVKYSFNIDNFLSKDMFHILNKS